MKWTDKRTADLEYNTGDTRIKEEFLLTPKQIGSIIKWFEKAKWQEEFGQIGYGCWKWSPIRWID